MDQIVVIANPVASHFTGGSHRDVMAVLSARHNVDALWPGSAAEATAAAIQAVEDGAAVVVAMGGDGMVHHVAQGLIGTDAALGIIPAGTTNVVARLFSIPSRHTKAARLVGDSLTPRSVGTARLTLLRGHTETVHHAIFACGVGLDAEVVRVADADPYRKYRFGSLHYARSALSVGMRKYPSVRPHVTFRSDERELQGTSALIQFRDIYTYFGRVPLRFGEEEPNPMSALILDRLRRRRIPSIFVSALTSRDLDDVPGFEVWRDLKSLSFEASPPVPAQADGEGLGLSEGGEVEWVPDSLLILAGASLP
jgi:diacylglycerol kinase family enzyme